MWNITACCLKNDFVVDRKRSISAGNLDSQLFAIPILIVYMENFPLGFSSTCLWLVNCIVKFASHAYGILHRAAFQMILLVDRTEYLSRKFTK
jgi:hypothetical protein